MRKSLIIPIMIVSGIMIFGGCVVVYTSLFEENEFGEFYPILGALQIVIGSFLLAVTFLQKPKQIKAGLLLGSGYVLLFAFWFYIRQADSFGYSSFFAISAGISQLVLLIPFIWIYRLFGSEKIE